LVVGFVCEGSTDIVVARAVVESVLGEVERLHLQPQIDELDRQVPGQRSGWSEVKAWCERVTDLDDVMKPLVGDSLDLLVIAIDLDIAVHAGLVKAPANLSAYDAKALCDIVKSWLPSPLPQHVIIAIPVAAMEAWVVAALFPKRKGSPQNEQNPAAILVQKKKIEMGTNGPWKRASEYRIFAKHVITQLRHVRGACSEADRFVTKLHAFHRQVS
jgi:hypothetical protein